ncbi:hypothetical protein BC941DRAFT_13442 [Chlamydoabsidia padenii]|nr:hypothetical protein BC941DRAFT_13442 [Chlamydoabsidia padenii]
MASDILESKLIEERMESDDMNQESLNLRLQTKIQLMNELGSLFRHRESLIKELFMIQSSDDLESSFMEFLNNGDMAVLDTAEWNAHGENDSLRQLLLSRNIDLPDRNDPSPSITVDALDSHSTPYQEIETPADQINDLDSTKDQQPDEQQDQQTDSTPTKLPALAPTSNIAKRTLLYTPPPDDSRLTPVQSYNNLRMEDTRGDKSGQLDLYAWTLKAKAQPLLKTLQTARKVLTTQDWNLAREELKSIKTVQQIEYLKSKHMWSLKQIRRHTSIPRTKTHWDSVLDEMKWMRTDFKEERKWKIASAYMMGQAVMEWHQAPDKSTVCVATRLPSPLPMNSTSMDIDNTADTIPQSNTPVDIAPMDTTQGDSTQLDSAPSDTIQADNIQTDTPSTSTLFDHATEVDKAAMETTTMDIMPTDIVATEDSTTDETMELQRLTTQISSDINNDHCNGTDDKINIKLEQHEDKDMLNNIPPSTTDHSPSTTPDDEETGDPQQQVTTAAWELLYQQLIKDCDPYHTVVTLPMENFEHLDITSLISDRLIYAPPDPNMNDPYFNEAEYGRIVPVTKLSTLKLRPGIRGKYNPRKRTIDGQLMDFVKVEDAVETLPDHDRYDTTLISPLFAPKKVKDTPTVPPTPQAPPSGARPPSIWTEEDELCLISLIAQFSFNWELICDAFNSIRAPVAVEKRTPWELHERWRQKNLTTLSGQINPAYATKLENEPTRLQSIVKFDIARKKQRQYSIFEAIKKTQRKREEIQKPTNNASTLRSTIESHGMNSSGKRLPTAMELSLHKVQRERQQALIEQRQLYGLNGAQTTNSNVGPRMHSAVASQVRPPTATTGVLGIQSTSSATPIITNRTNALGSSSMPTNPVGNNNVIRAPQPIPSNQNQHPALNRYPSAQLQLLRQQQMALMAAAQAQQQQQQQQVQQQHHQQVQQQLQQQNQQQQSAQQHLHQQHSPQTQALPQQQQQTSPMIRPPVPIPMQRFGSNTMMPMNQQPQANQASTLASVMQQQQQVQQQQQQQHASPVIQQQQSVPSQQQQQQQQPQNSVNAATSLAFAAQLAQMGYPIQQLPSNQQAQLQRYLAQLQMRNAAAQQQQIRQQQQQQQHHIHQQQQGLGNGSLMGMSPQSQHQQIPQQVPQPQPPAQMMSSPLMNQHNNNVTANATNPSYLAAQQQQQLQRFQQALLLQQQLQRQQQHQMQLQHPHQHQPQPPQSSSPMIQHPSYQPPT